jgi:ABC-type dipeptide/oligopeptide/nickel transport system permease component
MALARGDLGSSRRTFTPVADEIAARLPATAELVTRQLAEHGPLIEHGGPEE